MGKEEGSTVGLVVDWDVGSTVLLAIGLAVGIVKDCAVGCAVRCSEGLGIASRSAARTLLVICVRSALKAAPTKTAMRITNSIMLFRANHT